MQQSHVAQTSGWYRQTNGVAKELPLIVPVQVKVPFGLSEEHEPPRGCLLLPMPIVPNANNVLQMIRCV